MKLNLEYGNFNKPIEYFKENIAKKHDVVEYTNKYLESIESHPFYKHGWKADFFDSHRYMNWIIYDILVNQNNCSNLRVLDLGCYDGYLTYALNNAGIKTDCYDNNHWSDMFDYLDINDKVKKLNVMADIVVVMNYAHEFPPDQLMDFIQRVNCKVPSVVFFDFDKIHFHKHQIEYYKGSYKKLEYKCSEERELFVWEG